MRKAVLALLLIATSTDADTVRVTVADAATGQSLDEAYTAVVAEDRPWSEPVRELVGKSPSTFDVPAGRYRVVAGARGYTTEYEFSFAIEENGTREIALALKRLGAVSGKVVDADGKPVASARIGLAGQFTYDHASLLSPAAEELLRANTLTTSGNDGRFTLPALPDGRMVVVVEADGHAPLVLENARAGDLGTLPLRPGATLAVRWTGTAGATHDRFSLLPRRDPDGLSRDRAIALWTRPLSGSAQAWKSLPAGDYDVVLRGRPRAPHGIVPIQIAQVTLRAGKDRELDLALPAPKAEAPRKATRMRLVAQNVVLDALAAAKVTVWTENAFTRADAELAPASGGTLLTLVHDCAPADVTIETAEAIGAAAIRDCGAATPFALHRKATIRAAFTPPPGAKLPARGGARTARCDLVIPYAITDGTATVSLPTDCGDVALSIGTFAPFTVAARDLAAGKTFDVGEVRLHEGGAVLARVSSAVDGTPQQGVVVKAHRRTDLEELRGRTEPDSVAPLAAGSTDAQGWVRLYGLPAEEIVFTLRGLRRARADVTEAFRVRTGDELVLDRLTLAPPASIVVTLNVSDAAAETLLVHSVEAVPAEGNRWPERATLATLARGAKSVTIDDVPPGVWKVRALGRLEGGTLAVLGERRIEVLPGVSQNVTLDITDLVFRGRVVRGASPVHGTINLEPAERGTARRSVVATLDDDGRFHVLLEGAGDYIASLQESEANRGARLGRPVHFETPEDEVLIELPTGRIAGRVVRGDGSPVASASVSALRTGEDTLRGDAAGGQSGADGSFTIESISAGLWTVQAMVSGAASEEVAVNATGGDTSGVTLVVTPTRRVHIRVFEASGQPARRAFVVVEPPPADPSVPPPAIVRQTSVEGVVEVTIPRHLETNPTNVYVFAADQTLSCATLRLDADATIRLPAGSGEVRLQRKVTAAQPRFVASHGCSVPLVGTNPRLAAAAWSYVELATPQDQLLARTGKASLLPAIETFTVEPGRSTTVVVNRNTRGQSAERGGQSSRR